MQRRLKIGDLVSVNANGKVVPAKPGSQIIGMVHDEIALEFPHAPDAVERLAALTDDEIKKRVDEFDNDAANLVLRASIRMTKPFTGDVIVNVEVEDEW